MATDLTGRRIALLVAPRGTEEPEFTVPRDRLSQAGAEVVAVGLEPGEAQTVTDDLDPAGSYPVDLTVNELDTEGIDALVIPGGTVGADTLRSENDVVSLVRLSTDRGVPVAAICHAPWVLAEAGVVDGRRVTSYSSLMTDLRNAGAEWVDEAVVVDDGIITSRTPDDLDAFCDAIADALA